MKTHFKTINFNVELSSDNWIPLSFALGIDYKFPKKPSDNPIEHHFIMICLFGVLLNISITILPKQYIKGYGVYYNGKVKFFNQILNCKTKFERGDVIYFPNNKHKFINHLDYKSCVCETKDNVFILLDTRFISKYKQGDKIYGYKKDEHTFIPLD